MHLLGFAHPDHHFRFRLGHIRKWLTVWTLVMPVLGFVLGNLTQAVTDRFVGPWTSDANLPILLVAIGVGQFFISVGLWHLTRETVLGVAKEMEALRTGLGQGVRMPTQSEGYDEVRMRIDNAKRSVHALIFYEVQPHSEHPDYDEALLCDLRRQKLYGLIRRKLLRELNNTLFSYKEIVQLANERAIGTIVNSDTLYGAHCRMLAQLGKRTPDRACLKVSPVAFPNTVILVDDAFMYIGFSSKTQGSSHYEYPFLGLTIDDPKAAMVTKLATLFQRVDASARLVTNVD